MNRLVLRLSAALMLVLTMTACATRERYESQLQRWVGSNISVVMDAWGYPSGSFEAPSGNLVYVWDRQSSYDASPAISTGIYGGRYGYGSAIGFGFGGTQHLLRCQTYFEVDKKKTILSWRTQGNDCRK